MGSMLNALRCHSDKCEESGGFVLPTEPTVLKSEWKCQLCGQKVEAAKVLELCLKIEAQAEKTKVMQARNEIVLHSYVECIYILIPGR